VLSFVVCFLSEDPYYCYTTLGINNNNNIRIITWYQSVTERENSQSHQGQAKLGFSEKLEFWNSGRTESCALSSWFLWCVDQTFSLGRLSGIQVLRFNWYQKTRNPNQKTRNPNPKVRKSSF